MNKMGIMHVLHSTQKLHREILHVRLCEVLM